MKEGVYFVTIFVSHTDTALKLKHNYCEWYGIVNLLITLLLLNLAAAPVSATSLIISSIAVIFLLSGDWYIT